MCAERERRRARSYFDVRQTKDHALGAVDVVHATTSHDRSTELIGAHFFTVSTEEACLNGELAYFPRSKR